MLKRILSGVFLTALISLPASAGMKLHGTTAVISTCPHSGAGYADGCANAPTTGQFISSNFFTDARQSGQAQYKAAGGAGSNHPPPWDVAGVDYPVGNYTADGSLLDPVANPPSGWSYNAGIRAIQCGANPSPIQHYRFNGYGAYCATGGLAVTIDDVHQTMTADNCRYFTGSSNFNFAGPVTATSSTFDFDAGCQMTARAYKQAGDPGFTTQSSSTGSVSGTAMTLSSVNSGTVRIGQYIDCPGCTEPAQITAGSGLSWTLSVSQPALGPMTITTGPVEPTANGAFFAGGAVLAKYNADLGWGQFANGGNNTQDFVLMYNFGKLTSKISQHVNFGIKFPTAGTLSNYIQNFNTIYWDKSAYFNTGTGTLDQFVTLTNGGAAMAITTLNQAQNNTIITNDTVNGGTGDTTAAVLRYLSQGGGTLATINYSMTGGVLNVTSVLSGGPLAVGQYVYCGGNPLSSILCTVPIKITSFGTGTGGTGTYNVSNTVDTATGSAATVYLYPGQIDNLQWTGNYMDGTGSQTIFKRDTGGVPVGTQDYSGNINMLSGNACTPTSCP